jgi:hypothetical protein
MSAQCLYKEFLHEDFLDMVRKGYWSILPFDAVCRLPHLKLSPAGVVPQRERRPRPIMDYSFTAVNNNSLPVSPTAAMQLGHAFTRFLHQIAYANPAFGPPRMLKLDLADGYYRVRLTPTAALELAVVLPGLTPQENLVGIPLCLPMGWTQSILLLCVYGISSRFSKQRAAKPNHASLGKNIQPVGGNLPGEFLSSQ